TCIAVPGSAKFAPNTVAIAFVESDFTAGTLSPALTTPPLVIRGAVGDTSGIEVRLKFAVGSPAAETVTVNAPAVAPAVSLICAVPSGPVRSCGNCGVAAADGFTTIVRVTPKAGAPVESVTLITRGCGTTVLTVMLWLFPLTMDKLAGVIFF